MAIVPLCDEYPGVVFDDLDIVFVDPDVVVLPMKSNAPTNPRVMLTRDVKMTINRISIMAS